MKKGFTLVELLAVIVILGIISMIIFPVVTEQMNSSKKDLYQVQVDNIIKAAKDMVLDQPNLVDENHVVVTLISVADLKSTSNSSGNAYLENEDIKNPIDNTIMDGTVIVKYDENVKGYTYEYQEKSKSSLSSLIVTPAAKTIIGGQTIYSNEENVSGLFEDVANNEYVFKGATPNNYIKIDSSLWRIVSINKDTYIMKVAKVDSTTSGVWADSASGSMLLSNTSLAVYTYLNSTFYNALPTVAKNNIVLNSSFNVGEVSTDHKDFKTVMMDEEKSKANLNVGLLTVSDFLRASNDLECRENYLYDSKNAEACFVSNYLSISGKKYFLANTSEGSIWTFSGSNSLILTSATSQAVRLPVIYLKGTSQLQGSGVGTTTNPYVLK